MKFSEKDVLAFCGTNWDRHLVIILVSAENAVLHKYIVAKGCRILTAFLDNIRYSEMTLNQNVVAV